MVGTSNKSVPVAWLKNHALRGDGRT